MNNSFKLLPLLIIVAFLSFSVRLTEMVTGLSNISGAAFAESAENQSKEDQDTHLDTKENVADDNDTESSEEKGDQISHDEDETESPVWRDASDSDLGIADVKAELFKDLSERRDLLDKKEKKLQVEEALLEATKKEIELKYQELNKLSEEIKSLLDEHGKQVDKRIASLVKIYEGMKPKDAARIFDTLDIDVLIPVVSKMSERKVSPILAAMNPERVRTVTIMLAEQKKLPSLR